MSPMCDVDIGVIRAFGGPRVFGKTGYGNFLKMRTGSSVSQLQEQQACKITDEILTSQPHRRIPFRRSSPQEAFSPLAVQRSPLQPPRTLDEWEEPSRSCVREEPTAPCSPAPPAMEFPRSYLALPQAATITIVRSRYAGSLRRDQYRQQIPVRQRSRTMSPQSSLGRNKQTLESIPESVRDLSESDDDDVDGMDTMTTTYSSEPPFGSDKLVKLLPDWASSELDRVKLSPRVRSLDDVPLFTRRREPARPGLRRSSSESAQPPPPKEPASFRGWGVSMFRQRSSWANSAAVAPRKCWPDFNYCEGIEGHELLGSELDVPDSPISGSGSGLRSSSSFRSWLNIASQQLNKRGRRSAKERAQVPFHAVTLKGC
mmetsp:Transcript_13123/g.35936  ORF Transcript_13123/g.35936 Transcript_13123/m.35936 type:complete len:372 (+) Transcript_13123:44-1159(+)